MELGNVIAQAAMVAAAKVVNARNLQGCDAARLTECLRQVLREDLDGIMGAMKDAMHMGNDMLQWVLSTECTASAIKAVDLYQAS